MIEAFQKIHTLSYIDASGTNAALTVKHSEGWVSVMLPLRLHETTGTTLRETRLVISAGSEWFQIGGRSPVMLETRIPLRRLLLALAEMKQKTPGAVLPVTAAFEAGWPGERATPTAAAMRVYTAIHSLRRLGLRGILVRRRRGYVLDCEVYIAANESQIPPAMGDDQALTLQSEEVPVASAG